MSEDLPYWLLFLLALTVGILYGSRYMVDTALISTLNIEVRSATQSAASIAFSTLSIEGIGERNSIEDRAHRKIVLNKIEAKFRFEEALKSNLGLDSNWRSETSKYISHSKVVTMSELIMIDSTDLPYNYEGKMINEPSVIVKLDIPVSMYLTKRDSLVVVRIVPIRTFITNWQR